MNEITAENQIRNAANDMALMRTRPNQERSFKMWNTKRLEAAENPRTPRKMMAQLELECQLAEVALQAASNAEERFNEEVEQIFSA